MFRFKHFSIDDSLSAMKIGTDGVLLGAWADVAGCDTILDAGTGTGLIALMAAQRNAKAHIVAIDIVSDAAAEARSNADISPWSERIEVRCSDLREFSYGAKFDHIISNPPFFSDAVLPPNVARSVARHTTTLKFEDIVVAAERLLRVGGRLSLILPVECGRRMRSAAFGHLWLSRQTEVITRQGEPPKRLLMEFTLQAEPLMPRCDELTIQDENGAYMMKYRQMTEEFYLMF